ncbi:hypothetical protein YDYSG_57170 [Paenibacillus tyrfis]|nr:hypothetical protein YDYSG_57170 [Paenibacillus tyrfis]
MQRTLKPASLLFLSLILGATVTACGGSGGKEAGGAPAGGETKKNVTLDFVWFTDGIEGDVMKGLIKEYQEKNPHIKINLVEVAFKDLNTKLKTMITGGQPPAFARMTDTGAYAKQALDLTP